MPHNHPKPEELVGRRIVGFEPGEFVDAPTGETRHDPVMVLDNGCRLRFTCEGDPESEAVGVIVSLYEPSSELGDQQARPDAAGRYTVEQLRSAGGLAFDFHGHIRVYFKTPFPYPANVWYDMRLRRFESSGLDATDAMWVFDEIEKRIEAATPTSQ